MIFGFLQQIGMPELIIISFIILLLFGAKRLPELFRSMGKSIGEFKKATRDIEDEVRSAMDETEKKPSRPASHKPKEVESTSSPVEASAHPSDESAKQVSNN